MTLAGMVHIPSAVSVGAIIMIVMVAVLLSLWKQRRLAALRDCAHDLQTGDTRSPYRPAFLEATPRPVATEDDHNDAVLSAKATAPHGDSRSGVAGAQAPPADRPGSHPLGRLAGLDARPGACGDHLHATPAH